MTELKSYDLPELEALAEQIKAEIAKREQEEQERARQAAEAEAARQAQAAAEAAAQAAAEKAAEAARKVAEKKEATRKETARKTAEKKAAEEAAQAAMATLAAAPTPEVQEPARVRYMHPSNRALTWSGEGSMPDWISAWLVTGGTLYALEIAAEKLAPKPIPESFKLR